MHKSITTTWEVWRYEVWGNKRDGYEVNDKWCVDRELELELEVRTANPGSQAEFKWAYPTDQQVAEAFGMRARSIDIDGDDTHVYVTRARDGRPIGELYCTSHETLSPIKELDCESVSPIEEV